MCLITLQDKPIILDEGITVYKVITMTNCSVLHRHNWEDVPHLKVKIKESINPVYPTHESSDVYNGAIEFNIFGNNKILSPYKAYGEGIHFYISREKANSNSFMSNKIVECTVPKGAEVYYDETGLGVTNELIAHII